MDTLVSIIIPSYNSGNMVSDAIESVLVLAEDFYELIIVDDGSTDNTKEVLRPYFLEGKIKYVYQKNRGLSGARNTGIIEAKGDLLVFLDADDLISAGKLKKQRDYLDQNEDVDIVYSHSQWFIEDDFNNTLPVSFPIYEGFVIDKLIFGNFMHVNSLMIRKSKVLEVGCFDESLKELEDWDLWLRMVLSGSKLGFTPGIFSKVRVRKGSMTSDQNKMNLTMVKVLEKTIRNLEPVHSIQLKAHHALAMYQLKAGLKRNHFITLLKAQKRFGIKFFPITVKQIFKYIFGYLIKQNQTTSSIEKIWKK